jgi:hypothetical protein
MFFADGNNLARSIIPFERKISKLLSRIALFPFIP